LIVETTHSYIGPCTSATIYNAALKPDGSVYFTADCTTQSKKQYFNQTKDYRLFLYIYSVFVGSNNHNKITVIKMRRERERERERERLTEEW